MSDQPSPKPQSRVSLSLGAAPLLALSENAITPEVLSAAGHSAPEQSPSERVCSEDHSRISPCLGEGFSVLHGIFKADICAKAAHAAAVGATSYETAPAPKSFSTRVHEALSRLGVHGYCEELTWSSEETPETNEFLRGVRWRVLLGALPADHRTWADEIHWQREEYSRLREVFSFTQKTPPQPPLLTETGELKPAKLVNTHDLELFVNLL